MAALNRTLVALVGLVMLGVGTLGALVVLDVVSAERISEAIPYREAWDDWKRIDWSVAWVRWVLLGAALVIALLALALLLLSLRRRGDRGNLRMRTPRGTTTLDLGALRRAVEREAENLAGVERAQVEALRIDADGPPLLRYLIRAGEEAHLPTLGAQVAERGAASLERMLGRAPEHVSVVMEVRHDRRAAKRKTRVQ